jgi:hypothetical protein
MAVLNYPRHFVPPRQASAVTPARAAVLERVAAAVLALTPVGTVRFGIDGVAGRGRRCSATSSAIGWPRPGGR